MNLIKHAPSAMLVALIMAGVAPRAAQAQQFIISGSDGVRTPGSYELLAAIRESDWSGYANVEASARRLYAQANARGWDARTMFLALAGGKLNAEQANRLGNEYGLAGKATGPFGPASSFDPPPPPPYVAPAPFAIGPGPAQPAPLSVGPGPAPQTASAPMCAAGAYFTGADGGVYSAAGQRVRIVQGLPPSMAASATAPRASQQPVPGRPYALGAGGAPLYDPATRTYGSGSLDEVRRGVRQETIQADPHYPALTPAEIAAYVNGGNLPAFATQGLPYYLLDPKYGLASAEAAERNRANEVARFGPRGIMSYTGWPPR